MAKLSLENHKPKTNYKGTKEANTSVGYFEYIGCNLALARPETTWPNMTKIETWFQIQVGLKSEFETHIELLFMLSIFR